MLNYIKAELYRNFNRAYLWVYTGIFAAIALTVVIICNVNNIPNVNLSEMIKITTGMLGFPVFLVAAMFDMVTAEEQKNQTLRNVVTFGISRNKIVVSKVIVSVILALISAIIILVVFFGSAAALLGLGDDLSVSILKYGIKILVAVPLWIAAISVGTFLSILISNNAVMAFVYAGIFAFASRIIKLFSIIISDKFKYIHNILITTQLNKIAAETAVSQDFLRAALIGFIYTIVFTILSMIYFKRKEIK